MKLLIATGIYPPDIGGPAAYTKLIAEEFTRLGHSVTVITYGDEKLKVQSEKFKVYITSRLLPIGLRHFIYFLKVLKYGWRSDVIYAQDPVSAGLPAALAALLLRKKFFMRIAGDYAWEQGMQRFGVHDLLDDFLRKTYGFPVTLLRAIQTFCARRAERIIVPSNYLQTIVEKWGIAPSRIAVIYNAVSIPEVTMSRDEARAHIGLEGFILLSVGRLVPWKGFEMLIDISPDILKSIPEAKLIIVGSGPDETTLRKKVERKGLSEVVRFTGGLSKQDLALYVKAADVFLLNTGYEGFSHQILEAIACQIPIITTLAGGNKEVIQDKQNALVAPYNDQQAWEQSIIELHKDKTLYQKLAQPKTEILAHYTRERMIQETLTVLHI